jgi:hypothetical protein
MGRRGNPADAWAFRRIDRASRKTILTGLPGHFVTRNDKCVRIATP